MPHMPHMPAPSSPPRLRPAVGALSLVLSLTIGIVATYGSAPAVAVPLEVDHALVFDGVDDRATAGTEVIPTGGTAFTVEAWVYDADADAGWQHILSQGQGGTAFYLGTTSGSQRIRAGDTWLATGVDLPTGRWVHVALTTPGSGTAKLYLDGRLAADLASGFTGPTVTGQDFQLGTQYTTAEFWNGRIDTVRIWSVERSAIEIAGAMHAALPAATSGLIAQYLANEGTGTTVHNTATTPGGTTDLTLSGGTAWATVATSVDDGDDRVVTFPRSVHTLVGGWVVPDDATTADLLVVAGGGGGGAWVGGGGGAGGMVEVSGASITAGGVIPVTVGVGGRGAVKSASGFVVGTNGGDTSFGVAPVVTGGGVGASWTDQAAGSGGSGGGGVRSTALGANGTGLQGSAGGDAFSDLQPHPAGGGGGAGGPGQSGQSATVSGAGGPGRSSSITGASVLYAGGGGASSHGTWSGSTHVSPGTAGTGGSGGGGAGGAAAASTGAVRGGDGTAGLGGGGGGAANNCGTPCETSIGGDGGSGVVIIRLIGLLAAAASPTTPAAGSTLSTFCTPAPPRVGDEVACTVTGGDPDIDILWEVAVNPVLATGPVRLDARGTGTFTFSVPASAIGSELFVELVAWTAPQSLGVVGGPRPSSVPSGDGSRAPIVALLAAAALATTVIRARQGRAR